jgi:outer membrane lipoprotein-sorting protein
MCKKLILLFVFVLSLLNCYSASLSLPPDTIYTSVKDTSALKLKISKSSEINKTIESDFVQKKHLSIFTEPVISKGRFCYKNKTMVRWEYVDPFEYVVVINNGKLNVKDNAKVSSYDMTANTAFLEINGKLNAIIQGDIVNDKKDFIIKYLENNTYYLLKLKPLSKEMKKFFKEIDIYFDRKDVSVSIIKMTELSGDYTEIKFISKRLNVEIPDDKFILK